jgi:hypothetical protein
MNQWLLSGFATPVSSRRNTAIKTCHFLTTLLTRPIVYSFHLILAMVLSASGNAQDHSLELEQLRPKRVGIGGIAARAINGFHTPVIYQVRLDRRLVDSLLPDSLVPRLQRGNKGLGAKVEKVALKPGFLRRMSGSLHAVNKGAVTDPQQHFHELFQPMQPYNFALSGEGLSFARTGTGFGPNRVSKHAIISMSFQDIRFAGQLWRHGDTLWFNANSGTYMKKRKESKGLNPAPSPDNMLYLMQSVFEPALTVAFTNELAPYFGYEEASDQGEKALAAAQKAEEEAAKTTDQERAALLRSLAITARLKAERALQAAKAVEAAKEGVPQYLEGDASAGRAAMEARQARKEIEKVLDTDDD